MKVLVACEESQRVALAFREYGHLAFSCDLKKCSGGYPSIHFQEDCLNVINRYSWDMLIAFPPCTYFSKMNFLNYYRNGIFNENRFEKAQEYVNLFKSIWTANVEKIAIENPVPMKLFDNLLPKYTMTFQPYEFGENYSKKTCLWLKGLPPLIGSCLCLDYAPLITTTNSFEKYKSISEQSTFRSKTPWGVARAMARQWGNL